MRKFTVSALMLSLAAAGSSFAEGQFQPTDLFSGLYLGGGVGAATLFTSFPDNTNDGFDNAAINLQKLGNIGFAGQVFAGYGQLFNQFYLGGELSYFYNGAKPTITTVLGTQTIQMNTSDKNNLGLIAHLGYLVNPHFLPYVLVGAQYGQQKATASLTDTADSSNDFTFTPSKNKWGYVVGLGGMTPVWNNILLGGEVQYANFGTTTVTQTLNARADTVSSIVKNSSLTFLARLAYRFDI